VNKKSRRMQMLPTVFGVIVTKLDILKSILFEQLEFHSPPNKKWQFKVCKFPDLTKKQSITKTAP
jgi:hypothetical protein